MVTRRSFNCCSNIQRASFNEQSVEQQQRIMRLRQRQTVNQNAHEICLVEQNIVRLDSEKVPSSTSIETLKSSQNSVLVESISTEKTSTTEIEKAKTNENEQTYEPIQQTTSGKKKRTTSSSSTSSSSSQRSTATSNTTFFSQSSLNLPVLSPAINFFSSSSFENDSSNNGSQRTTSKHHFTSTHHHSKLKKSFHRHLPKVDRRFEQRSTENCDQVEQINVDLRKLNLFSTNDQTNKSTMRINTDTQKALEHLRELANHPSTLEKIQILANHPNLIQEIKKFDNPSFTEQLRTLPPFTPANISTKVENRITKTERTTIQQEKLHQRLQNRIDVDCQTESNHDTALTLACVGGHEELTLLLLQRGANIEHRDKKGFTPLILAGGLKVS